MEQICCCARKTLLILSVLFCYSSFSQSAASGQDHTIQPQIGRFVRVVGRPRQDWTTFLLKEGTSRFGLVKFERLLADRTVGAQQRWVNELRHLFFASE